MLSLPKEQPVSTDLVQDAPRSSRRRLRVVRRVVPGTRKTGNALSSLPAPAVLTVPAPVGFAPPLDPLDTWFPPHNDAPLGFSPPCTIGLCLAPEGTAATPLLAEAFGRTMRRTLDTVADRQEWQFVHWGSCDLFAREVEEDVFGRPNERRKDARPAKKLNGLLVAPGASPVEGARLALLAESGLPTVLLMPSVSNAVLPSNCGVVRVDEGDLTHRVVAYLSERGHSRIALATTEPAPLSPLGAQNRIAALAAQFGVASATAVPVSPAPIETGVKIAADPFESATLTLRRAAFAAAMEAHCGEALRDSDTLFLASLSATGTDIPADTAALAASLRRVLDQADAPTAIFCAAEGVVVRVSRALRLLGLHPGEDIALVGVHTGTATTPATSPLRDDTGLALTTIEVPARLVALTAARLLDTLLQSDGTPLPADRRDLRVPATHFTLGESS